MCESADLLHHIPGRMRLRIPGAKGNAAKLGNIQHSLADLPGVRRVDTNSMLGTIVIQYDPTLFTGFTAQLADYATEHQLFAIGGQNAGPCISEAGRSVRGFLGTLNRAVQDAMGNAINLKELLPLSLILYAFLFVDKAIASAQWLNWVQFAIESYVDLHDDEPVQEVAQTMDALFADMMAQQTQSTETLRAELASLRAEIQTLSSRFNP